MPFIIEGAPGRITSCEMHNKQAKKADADMGKAPSREKKIVVELDLSHPDFMSVLDERFAGVDLLTKDMAGKSADGISLAANRGLGDLTIEVRAIDGVAPVFKIDVAKSKGKPTLRIAKSASKVLMTITVVGSLPKSTLQTIDDYLGADVVVNVGEVQGELPLDGEKPKKKGKAKTSLALVDNTPAQGALV